MQYGPRRRVYRHTYFLGAATADMLRRQTPTLPAGPLPALPVLRGNILATVAAPVLPIKCRINRESTLHSSYSSKMLDFHRIGALLSLRGVHQRRLRRAHRYGSAQALMMRAARAA